MSKSKKIISFALCSVLFVVLMFACMVSNNNRAYAETTEFSETAVEEETADGEVTPRWLTSLSLSINGGDSKVWATVRNDFCMFFPKVSVILQLFCSYEYCEDYTQMTLVATKSIEDLDINQSLVVEASTAGAERFWLARMRYRENDGNWDTREVFGRYSADGTYLGLT